MVLFLARVFRKPPIRCCSEEAILDPRPSWSKLSPRLSSLNFLLESSIDFYALGALNGFSVFSSSSLFYLGLSSFGFFGSATIGICTTVFTLTSVFFSYYTAELSPVLISNALKLLFIAELTGLSLLSWPPYLCGNPNTTSALSVRFS